MASQETMELSNLSPTCLILNLYLYKKTSKLISENLLNLKEVNEINNFEEMHLLIILMFLKKNKMLRKIARFQVKNPNDLIQVLLIKTDLNLQEETDLLTFLIKNPYSQQNDIKKNIKLL